MVAEVRLADIPVVEPDGTESLVRCAFARLDVVGDYHVACSLPAGPGVCFVTITDGPVDDVLRVLAHAAHYSASRGLRVGMSLRMREDVLVRVGRVALFFVPIDLFTPLNRCSAGFEMAEGRIDFIGVMTIDGEEFAVLEQLGEAGLYERFAAVERDVYGWRA